MRRTIIGAIGGDFEDAGQDAREFGAAVARSGCILLTGGEPSDRSEVKSSTMQGAVESGAPARLIGFLPTSPRNWRRPTRTRLLIDTGLDSTERNAFNGLTPDVLVVFKGGRGTLTEMAFAWASAKPVYLWRSRAFLSRRFDEHDRSTAGSAASARNRKGKWLDDYVSDAWRSLPDRAQAKFPPSSIMDALREALKQAQEADTSAEELARMCVEGAGGPISRDKTGFPGFPDDPASKDRFEDIVRDISAGKENDP